MKKLLAICLLIPFIGLSQVKNVINATRVFPKQEKLAEFEKALASHAQKYHTGDWKWRVWQIESGPDAGGYMITEGPNSWVQLDSRGDLGAEHTADWQKNVASLLVDHGKSTYAEFQTDLSTVQITDYADKIIINHMVAKPGKINATSDLIKKLKNVWQVPGGESVAVYLLTASGDPGYMTVTRLKAGLKEMAPDYRVPMKDRYTTANGAGSYDQFLKDYADAVESRWSELLTYKPELSSK
jgi:hypothetical protein